MAGARDRDLEKKLNQYSDRYNELQRECRTLESKNSHLEQENQNLEQQTLKYNQAIHDIDSRLKAQQQQNLELERHLQIKDEQIAAFTYDIAQLSNERPDSSRDDHYFETSLSVLFRSIQSWVLGCYRSMQVPAHFPDTCIPPTIHDQLSRRLGGEWRALMQNNAFEFFQSYIISEMHACIFKPFLLGVVEGSQNLFSTIESSAGKSLIQCSSYVSLIYRQPLKRLQSGGCLL